MRSRGGSRSGQIGVGHAHASKLAVYRQSPTTRSSASSSRTRTCGKRAEEQAAYHGLPWLTPRPTPRRRPGCRRCWSRRGCGDLLDNAEACVAAGKHVHIDKPAGESLPQFRRILDAAAKQKLLVQMGYMYRYNPAVVLLREFLKKGWLGEVFEVHAVMSKVVDPADAASGWPSTAAA